MPCVGHAAVRARQTQRFKRVQLIASLSRAAEKIHGVGQDAAACVISSYVQLRHLLPEVIPQVVALDRPSFVAADCHHVTLAVRAERRLV